MAQWVVFGFGNYVSDIFDIITSRGGRVETVVMNIVPTDEQLGNLKRRISLLGYDVNIIELAQFRPQDGESYSLGFVSGREKLVHNLKQSYQIGFSSLVHPTAYLAAGVSTGEGVCIGPHAVLAPNCRVGDFSMINRSSSIGHDVVLGDFSTVGPGVTIAGMVKIGRKTTVGIGATIVNDISVGENSVVGAGSVVLDDVPSGVVVVGTPARILRRND